MYIAVMAPNVSCALLSVIRGRSFARQHSLTILYFFSEGIQSSVLFCEWGVYTNLDKLTGSTIAREYTWICYEGMHKIMRGGNSPENNPVA